MRGQADCAIRAQNIRARHYLGYQQLRPMGRGIRQANRQPNSAATDE